MKKCIVFTTILTMIFSIMVHVSYAKSNQLIYIEVVEVPNATKQDLFQRANIWAVSAFRNAKFAIQINDKDSGQIVGKGALEYEQGFKLGSGSTRGHISFIFKIFVKDGRYKYEFSEFIHEASLYEGVNRKDLGLITDDTEYEGNVGFWETRSWLNDIWNDIKKQISRAMQLSISSLKVAMAKKTESNDNW